MSPFDVCGIVRGTTPAAIVMEDALTMAFLDHSAGEGANQEVPHFHMHIHPRRLGDDVLRVYPPTPVTPRWATLDEWAAHIRGQLGQ